MLQEDIIWHRYQTLCSVSHRGTHLQYHIKSSFFNKSCASLPICVPVPLLVLESDWPLPTISPMYTLYGCPRLTRGPQVRCSFNFNAVSILICIRLTDGIRICAWRLAFKLASPSFRLSWQPTYYTSWRLLELWIFKNSFWLRFWFRNLVRYLRICRSIRQIQCTRRIFIWTLLTTSF